MKIGIITFHFPYNCGAVLQCAALQKALEKRGNEVEVINYKPWYHQNRYTPLKNPMQYAKSCYHNKKGRFPRKVVAALKGFFQVVKSWKTYKTKKVQDDKFQNFINQYMNTTKVYRTLKKLQKNPPKANLYISGSDQLWNTHITDKRFDEAYFMKFGDKNTGRITYSVGADFSEIKNYEPVLTDLVKDIDSIALREVKCKEVVEKCSGKEVSITIDPTFLLTKEDYEEMITKEDLETEPFIFTYTMPNDTQKKVYNAAKILSEKTGYKIIDASGQPMMANKAIKDNRLCGPDEFLWYMKHAKYVLTNSFHGTAFSIIMEKQFCVIPHSQTGNRAVELAEKMGLATRYVKTGTDAAERIEEVISYDSIRPLKEELVKDSYAYLENCIKTYGNK